MYKCAFQKMTLGVLWIDYNKGFYGKSILKKISTYVDLKIVMITLKNLPNGGMYEKLF